jgi:hypothetical protein
LFSCCTCIDISGSQYTSLVLAPNPSFNIGNFVEICQWKAQNKPVNKEAINPATYAGEILHIDASGPLPLPMGRKEFWLKIKDEFSGYSWDIL